MAKEFLYGIKEPSEIPEVAEKALDDFIQITKKLKIPACLAYGLCLGFVRDGGHIPGDNDLDVVAITETNWLTPDLEEALVGSGFKRGYAFAATKNIHFYRDNILLDIFFRKPGEYYAKFDTVTYKGKEYAVPHPVEDYLKACYTNWRIKTDEAGKAGV